MNVCHQTGLQMRCIHRPATVKRYQSEAWTANRDPGEERWYHTLYDAFPEWHDGCTPLSILVKYLFNLTTPRFINWKQTFNSGLYIIYHGWVEFIQSKWRYCLEYSISFGLYLSLFQDLCWIVFKQKWFAISGAIKGTVFLRKVYFSLKLREGWDFLTYFLTIRRLIWLNSRGILSICQTTLGIYGTDGHSRLCTELSSVELS